MNYKDLLTMMEYAGLSYKKNQPFMEGEHLCVFDDKETDIQYYIRSIQNTLLISFRGTDSFKDFFADIKFFKKKIPYGNTSSKIKVHSGFIDRYKSPQIRKNILSFITPKITKVIVVGHSYGGALATLCAIDIQYNHPHLDLEAVLFGAPRVGNKAFQKSFDKRLYKVLRVENGNDLVTKVPFKFMGFRHVGAPVKIGKKRLPFFMSWKDHHGKRYLGDIFKDLGRVCVREYHSNLNADKKSQ